MYICIRVNDMKKQIIQLFQRKAEAFAWIMEMVQDCTIGEITTNGNHLGRLAIIAETESLIYIATYHA